MESKIVNQVQEAQRFNVDNSLRNMSRRYCSTKEIKDKGKNIKSSKEKRNRKRHQGKSHSTEEILMPIEILQAKILKNIFKVLKGGNHERRLLYLVMISLKLMLKLKLCIDKHS